MTDIQKWDLKHKDTIVFLCLMASLRSPEMEAPYGSEEEQMRLLDLYRDMHSRIHSTSRPLKLIYHVAERETLLAWVCEQ